MNFNFGDEIKIILNSGEELEGNYIPSNDKEFLTIKLESGYNQSIKIKNIKSQDLIESQKTKNKKPQKIEQDESFPLIMMINIGLTIVSKIDYVTGAVGSNVNPDEILDGIPELSKLCRIETQLLSNVYSANIRFGHYNLIANAILDAIDKNVTGIIISHGTDTLHYTTAAISFILQNIKIPIVFVASQRSTDRPSSDGAQNVIAAVKFIVDQQNKNDSHTGIFLSMHESSNTGICTIFSGLNLRKMHSSRRDAFKQINSLPVAKVNLKSDNITYYPASQQEIEPLFEPSFFKLDIKVGILKSHPNLIEEEITNYKTFNGLIIEATGLGNMPVEFDDKNSADNKKILDALSLVAKKIPVIIATQCIHGSTNMNVYSYGRKTKSLGVLEAGAMTSETAFIKLAWLLSNFSNDEIKTLWNRNFIGEIINKTPYEDE